MISITINAEDGNKARMLMRELLTGYPDERAMTGDPVAVKQHAPEPELERPEQAADDAEVAHGIAPVTRERGKPSPGHARRTKAELAEDEAADKADAAKPAQQAISTGEERVDPENPEDAAADAADEAAETAATAGAKLTHDDIRNAVGLYVQKYGMDAAQQDGLKVYAMVCGDAVKKTSDVPEDMISKVVDGIKEMTVKNPFDRAPVKAA